jgi:hypothetical protein
VAVVQDIVTLAQSVCGCLLQETPTQMTTSSWLLFYFNFLFVFYSGGILLYEKSEEGS